MLHSKHTVAIPPGETIKEQLEYHNFSQKEFALRMGLSEKHISHLLNGKVELTQDVAIKLELVLGPPASFWNRREASYRETINKVNDEIDMEDEENLLNLIPYVKLAKLKWVPKTTDPIEKVSNLRSFFNVAKLTYLDDLEKEVTVFPNSNTNIKWAVDAFIQKVTIESRFQEVANMNQTKFRKAINQIKEINFSNPDLSEKLKETLATCGVVLVLLDRIEGTTFNGVSFIHNNHISLGLVNSTLNDKEYIISVVKDLYNNLYGNEIKDKEITVKLDNTILSNNL